MAELGFLGYRLRVKFSDTLSLAGVKEFLGLVIKHCIGNEMAQEEWERNKGVIPGPPPTVHHVP